MMQTLRCDDARPKLGRWYDGEIAGIHGEAIGAHVETCPRCAREIGALREIDQLLAVDVDAADLCHRVVAAARKQNRLGTAWWLRVAAAAAAALALGVFAGRALPEHPLSSEREGSPPEVFASLDQYFGAHANAGFDDLADDLGSRR